MNAATKAKKIEEAQKEYDFCLRMNQQYRIPARLADALRTLEIAKAA